MQRWKATVRAAAQNCVPDGSAPIAGDVKIAITYFYEGDSPDVDNIIKPIQDALNGVVFDDDSQVSETKARKRLLDGSYKIRGASGALLQAFSEGEAFLHIRVEESVHEEVLDA